MRKAVGLALLCLLALIPTAWAQVSTGTVYGKVTDESGAVLPGVTVTMTGTAGARSTVSGAQGEYRFLNVDPGTYTVSAAMQNFATINRQVGVSAGNNVNVDFGMKVKQLEEAVTVTGEAPIVDTKRVGTSTTLSKEELTQIPQSRDPWAVLKTVPGVLVDRVSIAGNEAGQQSVFTAKGASPNDTMYTLDGVVITDTSCGGCSSSYYDFDAFDEIKVDTGGNNLQVQSGGVGINLVTKRGTNAFHGGLHTYFSHDKLQSGNVPAELKGDARLKGGDKAEHIDQINDWGADLGGPIVKDKLWFWGSYGKNDIRLRRFNQTQDKTLLKNWNAKVNWQASSKDMASFFFFNGAKEKFGRSLGYAGNEPDSILTNQGNSYPDFGPFQGLHGLFKVEDNHIFNPNFFLDVKYSYYGWGYGFTPRGGTQQSGTMDFANDTAYGSSLIYQSLRPWQTINADASYFKTGTGGSHEFKFGFGYRYTPTHSTTIYPGGVLGHIFSYNAAGQGEGSALLIRDRIAFFKGKNTSAYVGDTFTKGRFTLNAGVRWDRQQASNDVSSAPASPLFPDLLKGITVDLSKLNAINWDNGWSPRVAFNYALDESRKTVLRGSYSRYAGQLNALDALQNNPAGVYYPYLAFNWVDLNKNGLADKSEILVGDGVQYSNALNPTDTADNRPPGLLSNNYKANTDHEFIVGLDRELAPNFNVGAAYTFRRSNNIPNWLPRVDANGNVLSSANYTANAPFTINTPEGTFSAQTYSPIDTGTGQRILENRPDYNRSFNGLELSAMKRLANHWMMRGAFAWMDWKEHYTGANAVQNPTSTQNTAGGTLAGPNVEGGQVILQSYGAKRDAFINSKWQASAAALYQLPRGFELGASLFGRQGYPYVVVARIPAGADGRVRALATPAVDSKRFDNLWNLDLRLAKNIKLKGSTSLNVTADVFNIFNNNVVLQRSRQVNAGNTSADGINSAFNTINELINPRVARIGLRLQF